MTVKRRTGINSAYWGAILFTIAQVVTFSLVTRIEPFLKARSIYVPPQAPPETISFWPQPPPATVTPGAEPPVPFWTSLGPILIYFFIVVIVLGVVLFLVPMSVLRNIMRVVFAFLFAWGVFIVLVVFSLPVAVAVAVALFVGLIWLLTPRVWLHNLAMAMAMVSVGVVFGRMISPWTAMVLLMVLAVYDLLAVRLGYMLWLSDKMSQSKALPAFLLPRSLSNWEARLEEGAVGGLVKVKPAEREFSILGGGDFAFPLLLTSSVYFAYGFGSALMVAALSLAGLMAAYLIQAVFLKGKPMPALPPIAALSLVGLLLAG